MFRWVLDALVGFVRRLLFGPALAAAPRTRPKTATSSRTLPPNFLDSPSAEPPIQPATSGEAPKIRTYPGLGIEFSATTDPRVKQLRRAAVIQIFELAGLGVVPGQFWAFLDVTPAPGDAVINFLAALGLDPNSVRNKDPAEVDRANDILDLLVDVDGAFAKLSEEARADIQSAIWCGEYERVRDAAQIVKTYLSILELGDAFPPDERFPAFTSFLRDVASELDNPMSAEKSDAEAADRVRLMLSVLLRRLSDAKTQQEALIKLLWSEFPEWRTLGREADITLALSRFDAMLDSILHEPHSVETVDDYLGHLEGYNSELRSILSAMAGDRRGKAHGSSSSTGGRSKHNPFAGASKSILDEALAYFGLDRARLPTLADFKKLKRKFWFKTHPDSGGSSEAFRQCIEYGRIIEDHLAPA